MPINPQTHLLRKYIEHPINIHINTDPNIRLTPIHTRYPQQSELTQFVAVVALFTFSFINLDGDFFLIIDTGAVLFLD